jgi:hypothetical protein
VSFWSSGFSAIHFFEDSGSPSPFIHSPNDVVLGSYNDPLLAQQFTQASVALLASLAGPVQVAVEVADFEARAADGVVELGWRLSAAAQRELDGVLVERAEAQSGPFLARGGALLPEPEMRFVESDVEPGRTFWYRLMLLTAHGTAEPVGPIAVAVREAAPRSVLHAAWEPPGGGPVQIRYALARPSRPPQLDIFDVRGRRLRALEPRSGEPGEHLLTWDRYDDAGRRVGRGVYLVRLEAGGEPSTRKLVLAHD